MGRLDGKIALITGGNSGIGLASAKAFAAEGARVVITGRDRVAVDAAVRDVGGGTVGITADVGRMADLDNLYAEISKTFDRLDVVFANAGIAKVATFQVSTEEHFDNAFNTNVKGLFFTVQKALPLLKDGASIILTSSVANFLGSPGLGIYSATKAAVRSFARSWTSDLKERRIRVNSLSPGPTETPMGAKMNEGVPIAQAAFAREKLLAAIPLGRLGSPAETAQAAVFLASDESSFVTGIDLCVDGGLGQI
jgi:NAD(P)-dependent dehydrogenase (short-subunit alcohol dehydrogenase family)